MIDPKPRDIGRFVVYTPAHDPQGEVGTIMSINQSFVFVSYAGNVKATRREDLRWTAPSMRICMSGRLGHCSGQ